MQKIINVCDFCSKEFNYHYEYSEKLDIKKNVQINRTPITSVKIVVTPYATIGVKAVDQRTIKVDLCSECIGKIMEHSKKQNPFWKFQTGTKSFREDEDRSES